MNTQTDIIGFPLSNTNGKRQCSFENEKDANEYFAEIEKMGFQRFAREPECPFLMITQVNTEMNFTTTFYYKDLKI